MTPVIRKTPSAYAPAALAFMLAGVSTPAVHAQTPAGMAPVLVTASRTTQPAAEALSDYLVIDSEEIARAGQATLLDLLQQKRGIEITRNGGPGTASSVFVRGADNKQTIVLIDGVRVGSATLGGASWAAIPLSQIARLEIVYGPLSTLYGADALGGVIQIFTKQGSGPAQFTGAVGTGSDGLRTIEAGVEGATGGDHNFRYAIGVAQERADGYSATKAGSSSYNPDRDGYNKKSASAQFSLDLAPGQEIGAKLLQGKLDAQVDLGSNPYDARGVGQVQSTAVYSKNQLLPNWSSLLQFSRGTDKSDSLSSTGISSANTRQDGALWQNDILFGRDLLQFLFERREEQVDSTTAAVSRDRATNSAAVAYQLHSDAHLVSAGLRIDDSSQYGEHTSGSLGYGYRFTPALRASATIGSSFRAPTFNELYFPNFGVETNKPEQGKNAELGVFFERGDSRLSAVLYQNRITDLLVTAVPCPTTPGKATSSCAYNVDKAVLEGLSLAGATRLNALGLNASLDFQDPHDETTGKLLNRRARRHGSLGADYAFERLRLGSELQFSDKRFDDAANRNIMGGYSLLNLYGSYDLARDWSLVARWNNVFDKNYEVARNFATPGANFFVGLRYGFR